MTPKNLSLALIISLLFVLVAAFVSALTIMENNIEMDRHLTLTIQTITAAYLFLTALALLPFLRRSDIFKGAIIIILCQAAARTALGDDLALLDSLPLIIAVLLTYKGIGLERFRHRLRTYPCEPFDVIAIEEARCAARRRLGDRDRTAGREMPRRAAA